MSPAGFDARKLEIVSNPHQIAVKCAHTKIHFWILNLSDRMAELCKSQRVVAPGLACKPRTLLGCAYRRIMADVCVGSASHMCIYRLWTCNAFDKSSHCIDHAVAQSIALVAALQLPDDCNLCYVDCAMAIHVSC